jgi:hypothetical protein
VQDEKLDFSLIACDASPLGGGVEPLSLLDCIELEFGKDDVVHIIGHPEGGEKQMSMQKVVRVTDSEVSYLADTLPGSSGSPVFKNWKLIALHNKGVSSCVSCVIVRVCVSYVQCGDIRMRDRVSQSQLGSAHAQHHRQMLRSGKQHSSCSSSAASTLVSIAFPSA